MFYFFKNLSVKKHNFTIIHIKNKYFYCQIKKYLNWIIIFIASLFAIKTITKLCYVFSNLNIPKEI